MSENGKASKNLLALRPHEVEQLSSHAVSSGLCDGLAALGAVPSTATCFVGTWSRNNAGELPLERF